MKPSRPLLNSAQQQAVEYVGGPLLIVAGAGTGKTTVITEKIAYLIEQSIATPEQILAVTFTDKAAAEMEERITNRLQLSYSDMTVGTFHALCQRLLEEYALAIGLSNRFTLMTETDAWMLVREHLDQFQLEYYRPIGNPTKHIQELIRHFGACKDQLISPEAYLAHAESALLDTDHALDDEKSRVRELANAYHTYQQLLADNQALDFADLIYYTVRLLTERPHIRETLQKKYRAILVDEFQDVNWAQYQLIRLLTGDQTLLTVVGDDDQSIYAFRGASVSNIMRFKDDYPDAQPIVLNENYRSGQAILDFAYASIQHNNPHRLEEKLGLSKRLEAKNPAVGPGAVIHRHVAASTDEPRYIIHEIMKLKDANPDASWDDFAILVRANAHAEPLIALCESNGIPYEFLAATGLFRQPIVLDCVNYFKAIENVFDSTAVYRLLRLPMLGLSDTDFHHLVYFARKKSIPYYEALERAAEANLSPQGQHACTELLSWIHAGQESARDGKPTKVLYEFLEKSGYLALLTKAEGEGDAVLTRQIYQLKEFFELVSSYEETDGDVHVSGFLRQYHYMIEAGDGGELYQPTDTPDSINILTVHAAKGLEFRYVFIMDMVEERFPTRRRGEAIPLPDALVGTGAAAEDHYEEERRLFYVAATRAKERLYLLSAEDYGGVRKKKISRFLAEVGLTQTIHADDTIVTPSRLPQKPSHERAAPAPIPPYEIAKAFSFSQLKSYETCPYQYKLAHILHIPTKSNASFSFGQSIHLTMQKFYERVQILNQSQQGSLFETAPAPKQQGVVVPTLDELFALYDESWIPDWYASRGQREDFYKKGKEILRMFYAAEEGHWTVPVAIEQPFKIMVGKFVVHGRIDRIDQQPDGSLEIIDYKTGAAKESVTGDEKDQLLIYQIAASTLPEYRHTGPVGKLTFYYLRDSVRTSFVGTDQEIEKLRDKVQKTIESIHERNFNPTPSAFACKHCDFMDICEFRTIS